MLVSSTGKMGRLGSDEAGVTVSHSGGAAAVDDAGTGSAAAAVREVLVKATATVELGGEVVVTLTSAAGKALSSVAQETKINREGLKRVIVVVVCGSGDEISWLVRACSTDLLY